MNLKKSYFDIKNNNNSLFLINIGAFLGSFIVFAGLSYLLNLLWNYVAPAWGLPVLGYLQFSGSILLLKLLIVFLFGLDTIKQTYRDQGPPIHFMKMVKDPTNE